VAPQLAQPHFFGEEMYGLFKQVKGFSTRRIFSILATSCPAMTDHLRYGERYAYRVIPLTSMLISARRPTAPSRCATHRHLPPVDGDDARPSATRDEQHSTRGRANALRAAISGQMDFAAPGVYDTLDLCVSCKACKTECPSSVDMAKLKAEYLHQFYKNHPLRVPLRSHFFSYFGDLSKRRADDGSAGECRFEIGFIRGMMNRVPNLAPARPPPLPDSPSTTVQRRQHASRRSTKR
jgi:ferredoxin